MTIPPDYGKAHIMLIGTFIGVAIVVVALLAGWFLLGTPGPDDRNKE